MGTFNPLGGQKVNYYYGRETNQTWNMLSRLFNQSFVTTDFERFKLQLQSTGIACMDLIHSLNAPEDKLKSILGKGYSDSKIINKSVVRDYNTDRILKVIQANKDIVVYSTWGKGPSLNEWTSNVEQIQREQKIINLVSPSLVARVPKGKSKYEFMFSDWSQKISIQ